MLFILDPDLDFFTHPGTQIQGSKRHRTPDPQHSLPQSWQDSKQFSAYSYTCTQGRIGLESGPGPQLLLLFFSQPPLLQLLHPSLYKRVYQRWAVRKSANLRTYTHLLPVYTPIHSSSVANPNPDPSDPYVFGPPGSGSGSISQVWIGIWILLSSSKNGKKNPDSYCSVTSL
jgi:hypothetical protein